MNAKSPDKVFCVCQLDLAHFDALIWPPASVFLLRSSPESANSSATAKEAFPPFFPFLALTEGARRATGVRAKNGKKPPAVLVLLLRLSPLKWRLWLGPLRIKHVFKRQVFGGFA